VGSGADPIQSRILPMNALHRQAIAEDADRLLAISVLQQL
jgi:hypothetical protein